MSTKEKTFKRERAFAKLNNQISVLSRTVASKDQAIVKQIADLCGKLSLAK